MKNLAHIASAIAEAMSAPRLRDQRRPPAPPDRLPSPRGGLLRSARALAAAALLALPATAQAQTTTTFVSNTEEFSVQAVFIHSAQSFTTGSNAGGYMLSEVDLRTQLAAHLNTSRTYVTVKRDASGEPGDLVATLSNPESFDSFSIVSFTAPESTTLAENTVYWVVVNEEIDGVRSSLGHYATQTSDQTSTMADPNWSIADTRLSRANDGAAWSSSDGPLKIAIKGDAATSTLSGLVVNDGTTDLTLTPTFASDTYAYAARVEGTVDSVTVTPTRGDSRATIEYLDGSDMTLTDADTTKDDFQLPVAVGDTVIKVKVTAADSNTTHTYTVTVNRPATTYITIAADHEAFTARLDRVTFTLTRTEDPAAALTVGVALTQDQDLLGSEDLAHTVTFRAGEATAKLGIEEYFFENTTVTGEATLTATVQDGSGYVPGSPASASTQIRVADPAVTVWIEETAYTFDEGVGADAIVAVILRTATGVPVPHGLIALDFSLKGLPGQAESPLDYASLSVNIWADPSDFTADGAEFIARKEVTLTIVDDALDEPDETLTVRLERNAGTPGAVKLTQPDGTVCPSGCEVTVTITDNDEPIEVTIAADHEAFTAQLDRVSFTLTRTKDPAAALDVAVALTQDEDLIGSEYLAHTVTFEAGEATAKLRIGGHLFAGSTVTGEATLTATVQDGSGYVPGSPASASTRIRVADPAVTVWIEETAYTFDEGVGADAIVAVILRTATGVPVPHEFIAIAFSLKALPEQAESPLDYASLAVTILAEPSDFTADGTEFTARKEVTLTIVDDALDEPDETLTVSLERIAGTPEAVALTQPDGTVCPSGCEVTVTITDNDESIEVTIAADQPAFTAEIDDVTFTLTRTEDPAAALTVRVALTQDQDLLLSEDLAQNVTFGAGEATATLQLLPDFFVGHTVTEETTLTATVQAGSGYVPGSPNTASTRIVVTDPAVTASIEATSYTFAEGADATVAVILRTATGVPSPNRDIALGFSFDYTSGLAGSNDLGSGSVSFDVAPSDFTPDGAEFTARKEVTLPIVDDALDEPDETLALVLDRPPQTSLSVVITELDGTVCPSGCSVTVTITDNDAPDVTMQTVGGATWTLTGERTPAPGDTYTYSITLASGAKPTNEYVGFYLPDSATNQDLLGNDHTDCAAPKQFCATFTGATGNTSVWDGTGGHDTISYLLGATSPYTATATLAIDRDTPLGTAITFGAIDKDGTPRSGGLTITVTEPGGAVPNTAPVITTTSPVETPENGTAVATLAATDADGDPITWTKTGGVDTARFALTSAGVLTFVAAPDYEDPADVASADPANAAANNEYVVFVTASDGTADTADTELVLVVQVTNANEGQSGTVSIDDTAPMVGDELTASTAGVADPDGLPDPFAPTYQWYRTPSGGSETEIAGESSATYTVVEADVGAVLTAKASWTDDGGFTNTLASAATAAVTRAEALPTVTVAAATGGETVPEGTDAAFTLSRTGSTTAALTVTVTVSETGSVLKDASTVPSSVTFDAGAATATLALATNDDDTDDDDGTVTVTLGADTGYTVGDPGAATVAVSDNDTANAAPSFASSATFDAAENQTTVGTVRASDDDTGDDITGYVITGGADQSFFSIEAMSGALTFDAVPNFEDVKDADTDNEYEVTVQATSGTGERVKTATQAITVTVIDDDTEAPGAPDAPTVTAASATSLTVTWAAPANAGPAITDYDVQYRAGTSGTWSDGNHTGTATTATLSSLSENMSYQVQVRATNDEGTGDWSDSGSGSTMPPDAPDGFMASSIKEQMTLTWTAPDEGADITRHEYRFKTTGEYPDEWTVIDDSAPGGAHEAWVVVMGLTNDEEYTFQLRAVNAVGAGTAVEADSATPRSGVCGRTEQVRDAIVAAIDGVSDCADVTTAQLAGVTYLGIPYMGIRSLQSDDFSGLTALTGIRLDNNELSSLPPGVFTGLTSLTGLYLYDNALSSLPDDVFTDLTSLEKLQLQNNALSSLPDDVFTGLTALTQIILQNNALSSLPDDPFTGLTALQYLRLQENQLGSLPAGAFTGLTALERIYLEDNALSSLPDDPFTGLTALVFLHLNDNALSSLPDDPFTGLTALQDLRLYNNALSSLPADVFTGLTALKNLWLDGNELSLLPADMFTGLTALTHLWLQENQLGSLPAGVFTDLTELWVLDLYGNELSLLPAGVFTGLTKLQRLWLKDNELSSLPDDPFTDMTELWDLRLDNNALSSLPAGAFTGLTALRVLRLDGNTEDPLPLTVTLEKVGSDQVRAEVPMGAPFAVDIPVMVENGALAGDANTLGVAVGSVEGTPVMVTRTAGTTAAVTADIDLSIQPTLPDDHAGYIFARAASGLPKEVLPSTDANAVVTIEGDDNLITEEAGAAGFTLSRTGSTAATLTVTVAVTQQVDRDLLPDGAEAERTVEFAVGSATAVLSVELENDDLKEAAGDLTVEVRAGSGYTVGDPASATVKVSDTDSGRPTPANLRASVGAGVGEVVLSWDAHAPYLGFARHQYRYKTDGDYPAEWTDIPNSGQYHAQAGDGSNLTGYTVTGLVGGQLHTFGVRTYGSSSSASDPSDEATATPRSAVVSFGAESYSVDEGGTVAVTVQLDAAPGREVVVPVSAAGAGGATPPGETGADWSGVPESVTFGATDTAQTFTLAATDDADVETGESVALSFGTLPDWATAGTPSEATVTITDAALPMVTIAADSGVVIEEAGAADFTLSRTGSTTAALSVELENDDLLEARGELTVEVRAGSGYTVGDPGSATVDVTDVDTGLPTPANLMAEAGAGAGVGEVELSWDAYTPGLEFSRHQYRYKTDGDYPAEWMDIPNSGQNNTQAGDGSNLTGYTVIGLVGGQLHTFQVRTFSPRIDDPDRTSDPSDEATATPRSAVVSFGAVSYSVDEGGTVEVTVQLDAAPGRAVVVPVSAAGAGGATPPGETGADWSGVPENVTFGATDTAQTFTLAATDDTDVETGWRTRRRPRAMA